VGRGENVNREGDTRYESFVHVNTTSRVLNPRRIFTEGQGLPVSGPDSLVIGSGERTSLGQVSVH
jgi:hypothetical protein